MRLRFPGLKKPGTFPDVRRGRPWARAGRADWL